MKKKFKSAFSLLEISIVLLVISILISTISLSANLIISKAKLKSAQSLTKSAPVNTIGDATLWLEPTLDRTFLNSNNSYAIKNGDNIKNWYDINTTGVNFTATESTNMPSYVQNGIGGIPTLFFDASANGSTGDYLAIPYNAAFNTENFSLFIVTQAIEQTSNWGAVLASRDDVNTSNQKGYNFYKDNSNTEWEFWTGLNSTWNQTKTTALTFKNPEIFCLYKNSTQDRLYKNSILKATSNTSFTVNNFYPFTIGAINNVAATFYYDGYISEIIYFNRALRDEERTAVEKYLSKKYNISLS